MGRRGYVQTRPPKYGACITDWAQSSLYRYLTRRGLEIDTPSDEYCNPEDSDHWEIFIPEKGVGRGKQRKWVYDYDKVLKVAADLRKNPRAIKADGEGAYGDIAACLLEAGVKTAQKYKLGTIVIDWR